MRPVDWSEDALDDLEALLRYVARDRPKAALALADRIDEAATGLMDMPTGRPGRVAGAYEKVVRRTPYIMAYALSDARVTILRVIHSGRDWRDGEWPTD